MIRVTPAGLPGLLVLHSPVFEDERGFFSEAFNERDFEAATGLAERFVQDNHSRSMQWVLRGLHYQVTEPQGKLVRVLRGRVFDVAVDMRRGSPTLGRWAGMELGDDGAALWVPAGFAHGLLVLSESADVLYKTTRHRVPEAERALAWDDPQLAIAWPLNGRAPLLSPRDATAPGWSEAPLIEASDLRA